MSLITFWRQFRHSIADRLESIFLWPFFGGVTTIAGVVAGYLGAHYDPEIAITFLVPVFLNGHAIASGATQFWLATAFFGICFSGTFWAQARGSNRIATGLRETTNDIDQKSQSLVDRAQEISERVRRLHTLPPVGFLESFRRSFLEAESGFWIFAQLDLSPDEMALAIRLQLKWVLGLVTQFDADGGKAKYGVNVMIFRSSSSIATNEEIDDIEARLRFVENGVSVTKLKGVLDLMVDWSVSTDSSAEGSGVEIRRDANLQPLALPIPNLTEAERAERFKNGVLPGAPDAFVSKVETVIESSYQWNLQAESDHFSRPIREQMKQMMEDEKSWMQSFFCVPLFAPDASNGQEPFAILNVHRNIPNTLAAEKMELLAPMLVPFTRAISRLAWQAVQVSNS
jgi:hypothetical protein